MNIQQDIHLWTVADQPNKVKPNVFNNNPNFHSRNLLGTVIFFKNFPLDEPGLGSVPES